MFKRVLLCYDGSTVGRRALKRGAELGLLLGAEIHVLSIIPSTAPNSALVAGALGHVCLVNDENDHRRLLVESLDWLKARGVVDPRGYLVTGNTIDQIAAHAKKLQIDLIVLSHYPQPAGGFWWTGPQRESLAERTNCCIFVAVNADDGIAGQPK
jgi:nucleotide-binding universal stress UspA family protein